jgi:hypothetical protein
MIHNFFLKNTFFRRNSTILEKFKNSILGGSKRCQKSALSKRPLSWAKTQVFVILCTFQKKIPRGYPSAQGKWGGSEKTPIYFPLKFPGFDTFSCPEALFKGGGPPPCEVSINGPKTPLFLKKSSSSIKLNSLIVKFL